MPIFVIDEDMPRSTGRKLQEMGCEVRDIRDYDLRGAKDDVIYQFAQDNQAVLITSDMGFSNILALPHRNAFGYCNSSIPFSDEYQRNKLTAGRTTKIFN